MPSEVEESLDVVPGLLLSRLALQTSNELPVEMTIQSVTFLIP
jgi:hypothetical protein